MNIIYPFGDKVNISKRKYVTILARNPSEAGSMAYLTRLKDLREDKDMTQKDLALLLQTTQPQIHRYEAGQRDLPLDKVVFLCRYFNVSSDYFLGLPDGMPYGHSKTKKGK